MRFERTFQLSCQYPSTYCSAKLRIDGAPTGRIAPVLGTPKAVSLNWVIDPVSIMNARVTAVPLLGTGNAAPGPGLPRLFATSLHKLTQNPLFTSYDGKE